LKVIYENIVGGKRMKHCARNDVKGSGGNVNASILNVYGPVRYDTG
jgi:hypothetical protein